MKHGVEKSCCRGVSHLASPDRRRRGLSYLSGGRLVNQFRPAGSSSPLVAIGLAGLVVGWLGRTSTRRRLFGGRTQPEEDPTTFCYSLVLSSGQTGTQEGGRYPRRT